MILGFLDNVSEKACVRFRFIRRSMTVVCQYSDSACRRQRGRAVNGGTHFALRYASNPIDEYLLDLSLASWASSPATYSSVRIVSLSLLMSKREYVGMLGSSSASRNGSAARSESSFGEEETKIEREPGSWYAGSHRLTWPKIPNFVNELWPRPIA